MAEAPETNPKIDSLRAKVEADPKSRHFYPFAEELRKVGRLDEAEAVLRAGLEHHSTYLSAWIGLGRLLKDKGAYPEALDVLMRGLSLDPENVVAAKLLANVYLSMGEKVEAIKKLKLVHALMPSDEEAEEQIAQLEAELRAEASPEPTSPHDATEPPFPMPDPASPPPEPTEPPAGPMQPVGATNEANFDLTNPDPFALGVAEPEIESPAEPELPDETEPFSDAELPEGKAAVPEEDPFAAVPDDVAPPQPQRAPSSEDVWADDEESSGVLPESAATVTMARILLQQGDLERAKQTFERVLEREPSNAEAMDGLAALERRESRRQAQAAGSRVERLEAWRRKVVGS